MSTRIQAIRNLYSTVVTIDGDNCYDNDYNLITIDESLITAEIERLEEEYIAKKYSRDRDGEYPDIKEQLDYIYHNGLTKWKSDMIKPVKDKYPK